MNLKDNIDTSKYKGILEVSDIHGEYQRAIDAIDYASDNDLFIVFIGDLIDGGHQPREMLLKARSLMDAGEAACVIGNHEDKHYRNVLGNPVKLNQDQLDTIVDANDEQAFYTLMREHIEHKMTSHYMYYDKTIFVHGAAHRGLWDFPETITKPMKAKALYGETTGKFDDRGYAIRTYEWTKNIPVGHQVVVGHDCQGLGKPKTIPYVFEKHKDAGRVYFTDTGCGKIGIPDNRLTGTVFLFIGKELEFAKFETFK